MNNNFTAIITYMDKYCVCLNSDVAMNKYDFYHGDIMTEDDDDIALFKSWNAKPDDQIECEAIYHEDTNDWSVRFIGKI